MRNVNGEWREVARWPHSLCSAPHAERWKLCAPRHNYIFTLNLKRQVKRKSVKLLMPSCSLWAHEIICYCLRGPVLRHNKTKEKLLSDLLAGRTDDSKHLHQSSQIYRSSTLSRMCCVETSTPRSAFVSWCKTNTPSMTSSDLWKMRNLHTFLWLSLCAAFEHKLIKCK